MGCDMSITRIVSGGQTGADRGGLDAAIASGVAHGGWCPKGRLAEDGVIPERYRLTETAEVAAEGRTRKNVTDSDGTVLFTHGEARGGSLLTLQYAEQIGKPLLHLDVAGVTEVEAATRLRDWAHTHEIVTLNVAGERESEAPGIHAWVRNVLERVLGLPR
jgi:hypothetical protein